MASMKRSQKQHSFARIPRADIPRSQFDRSSGNKFNFDAGYLNPCFVDEMLPGDTFNLKVHHYCRLATPLHPYMDNLHLDFQFFFVPLRILWTNFVRFMGEQDNPTDSIDYTIPQMTSPGGNGQIGGLSDLLGIPPYADAVTHSAMFHRAYNKIFNAWYRSQDIQTSVVEDMDDGPDDPMDYELKRRGKRHDYFSSCLPWPQKGDAVELSFGGTAPVAITGSGAPTFDAGNGTDMAIASTGVDNNVTWDQTPGGSATSAVWNDTALSGVADLSSATGQTINAIRQAFQIQRLMERDARGGSRYVELVRSHFGVTSPDQRHMRPEYLGGGTSNISVTPVPVSSGASSGIVGELAGYGVSVGSMPNITYSATEHGIIMGLVSIRADLGYSQGLHKMFSRLTKLDFFWPALGNLGESAVLSKEIFVEADGTSENDDVFGYQERWAEYRYRQNQIGGSFRSDALATLDSWHLAQKFTTRPTLSPTYIEDTPPVNRIIAVTSQKHMLGDFWFDLKCARPIPTYSVPGMIDHF